MFLYEGINERKKVLHEIGRPVKVPDCIKNNLNPNFELRPYQKEAFENFITHFEGENCPKPTQVLFHMATGSGKTLIMAGLMLYLYEKGYRNFLFFVNLGQIVKKTKENFLNASSSKFLFAQKHVKINPVENFQESVESSINICFTTIQGLHSDLGTPRENGMTISDFEGQKVVLISDEAHHLNVATKTATKINKGEKEHSQTWEETVKSIFEQNRDNVLLEFTATCELENKAIRNLYEDKIIFNYPLSKYYDDKYSKDILTLRSDLPLMDKALQALVLSQYRLKVFQENHLTIKPVVLFKSASVDESHDFKEDFLGAVKNLTGEKLESLSKMLPNSEIMRKAYNYFKKNNITFDALATELIDDFSEEHCTSVNEDTDLEEKQVLLNSLEDEGNPYRAIFEVKKLDEGWDVLNLFDIVRLYETRQSGGAKTIQEAQLIGRGARYCPFRIEEEQPKYQRKYDSDVGNELRVCETLYYHCQNDSRYIAELKSALREIGLDTEEVVQRKYTLKESFKSDPIYTEGLLFLNKREEIPPEEVKGLPNEIIHGTYSFNAVVRGAVSDKIMDEEKGSNSSVQEDSSVEHTTNISIGEIAKKINYAIVNKALREYQIYKFSTLKSYFPNLSSTRDFIEKDDYLGNVKIEINSVEAEPTVATLYSAVLYVLGKIATEISGIGKAYRGTKEFYQKQMSDAFTDKIVNYTRPHSGGGGVSQNDPTVVAEWRIDLSKADWFAHTDNFGTSEEKAFVAYIKRYIGELKKKYCKVYLVRNERQVHIYSFDKGERFEPDFLLFLQRKKASGFEQFQIFIEPKGSHILEGDMWKQRFLLQMKENAIPVKKFKDDKDYRIWGLHFFNKDEEKEFDEDFSNLLGSNVVEYDSEKDSTILIYSSKKQISIKAKAAEDEEAAPYGTDDSDELHNAKDGTSETPLMKAARVGNLEAAKFLIEYGTDLNARTRDGKTALSIAKERGHQDIVDLLLAHGAKE